MMTLKDSRIDRTWLAQAMASNPPRELAARPGEFLTGPVRLAFVNIFERGKAQKRNDGTTGEGKFGATLLFPPSTNLDALYRAWWALASAQLGKYYDAASQRFVGVEPPWHDQVAKTLGEKPLAGYESGSIYLNSSSKYQPSVVDASMNPIVDPARVYPGVWAMAVVKPYVYGVSPPQPKKGIGFGMQTLMIIGDDTKLAGGGVDPKVAFAGVQISGNLDVAKQFGGAMPGGGFQGAPGGLAVPGLPPAAPAPASPAPVGMTQAELDALCG